eukprot:TRINITY_DN7682_c0_g1_i2.p1 TRINITY_DN7682_c0_g1~~TRINITY_DN7682_c0_g1_i2.p1  ORF type:complete len:228 (-),score=49.50 TRINITY_DN7682_c0_g1_i2:386-1009(-)
MGSSSVFAEYIRPPEVQSGVEKIGYPTDIYSFGILMFQVITGKDITKCSKSIREEIKHFDVFGHFDEHSETCIVELLMKMMSRCLDSQPDKRPGALQLWLCLHISKGFYLGSFSEFYGWRVENLHWDEMGNLHWNSPRDGALVISKKKGSSWILVTEDQIRTRFLILEDWDLLIFTESGDLLRFDYSWSSGGMTGWDCSGLPREGLL